MLLVAPLFGGGQRLHAQALCSGNCEPLSLGQSELNDTLIHFRYQYLNGLMTDMNRAASVTGASMVPMGMVNLYTWTVGTGIAGGMVEPYETGVVVPNYATYEGLTSGGASVSPRFFIGANLGHLFFVPNNNPLYGGYTPRHLTLQRFDIYVSHADSSGMRHSEHPEYNLFTGLPQFQRSYSWRSKQSGVELRYHLVEAIPVVSPLFNFLGVSLGVGYHTNNLDLKYIDPKNMARMRLDGKPNLIWDGTNFASLRTRSESYPIELRTGVQLLYFLNLTVAGGMVESRSTAEAQLLRFGPVYLDHDLERMLDLQPTDTMLMLHANADNRRRSTDGFAKLGVEINLWKFKIFAEAIHLRKHKGAQIGLRFEM